MRDGLEGAAVVTGRPLADDGTPIDGLSAGDGASPDGERSSSDGAPTDDAALVLDPEGRSFALLESSPRPLVASPGAGTWATLLSRPDEGDDGSEPEGDGEQEGRGERPELLQWLAPDATEPPAHVHPTTETFEAIEGELTLVLDGEAVVLEQGESYEIEAGVEHAFRNDTDGVVAFRAALPSMRTVRALYTVWGGDVERACDGGRDPASADGQPGPLTALLLAEALHGETTMTAAPAVVQRIAWTIANPIARGLGYSGIEERYLTDEFWERRVEQP